ARDLSGIPQGQVQMSHPLLGNFNVPTPETYNQILAQRAMGVAQPQIDIANINAAREQAQELFRKIETTKRERETRASTETITKQHEAAETARNAATNANRLQVAQLGRLNNTQTNQVLRVGTQFDNNPITRRYSYLQEALRFANSTDVDKSTDDDALITAYA